MYSIEMPSSQPPQAPLARTAIRPVVRSVALPDHLQQAVWPGHGQASAPVRVLPSGHASQDTALPGGGWPIGCLTEILQTQAGQGEWRLLGPALSPLASAQSPVLLVNPPHEPGLLGLQSWRIPADSIQWAEAHAHSDHLWVIDQALKADCFSAILAWLPHTPTQVVRRLQAVAAHHGGLFFGFRGLQAAELPSAAPLRLSLHLGPCPHPLQVRLLKRRGSPWPHPIVLPVWPVSLARLLPMTPPGSAPLHTPPQGATHAALDRTRSLHAAIAQG